MSLHTHNTTGDNCNKMQELIEQMNQSQDVSDNAKMYFRYVVRFAWDKNTSIDAKLASLHAYSLQARHDMQSGEMLPFDEVFQKIKAKDDNFYEKLEKEIQNFLKRQETPTTLLGQIKRKITSIVH